MERWETRIREFLREIPAGFYGLAVCESRLGCPAVPPGAVIQDRPFCSRFLSLSICEAGNGVSASLRNTVLIPCAMTKRGSGALPQPGTSG